MDTDCESGSCPGGTCACTTDADGDGYASAACGGNDCNDFLAAAHPGAVEICGNQQGDKCDGTVDCPEVSNNGVDDDGDGIIDCADAYCEPDPACATCSNSSLDGERTAPRYRP